MIDENACHAAVEARDPRFDGRFFTGVTSTGVYCRCVCPARAPKRENRRFFPSAAAAEKGGFRPCLLCRPEAAPGSAPIDSGRRLAAQALSRIEAGALEEQGLEALAADLGVTDRHLRRAVRDLYGASPVELAQTHRLLTAKRLLSETALPVTEVAFASGFKSLRRFNALFLSRYGFPPSRIRKRAVSQGAGLSLALAARGAFDPTSAFAFLASRRLSGVEVVTAREYRRTFQIGAHTGWLGVAAAPGGIRLTLSDGLAPALRPLLSAVRGAFDLDVDVAAIDAMLGADPTLRVGDDPGVRIPGILDPFEATVRAVLGQQVTVAAGRTLAQRLVDLCGEQVEHDDPQLTRLFPSAARIASAGADAIQGLGMPRARADTLVRVAEAALAGRLPLARGAWNAGRAALAAVPGVGPWTVEYVALRGLGDPDAFPASDSAVRAALAMKQGVEARAEAWRPWRGYATIRLWRNVTTKGEKR